MKRKDVLRHLNEYGCSLKREGGSHSVYFNSINKKTSTVHGHTEKNDFLVKKICKDLDIKSL
jgi:mRNA interferase HicA